MCVTMFFHYVVNRIFEGCDHVDAITEDGICGDCPCVTIDLDSEISYGYETLSNGVKFVLLSSEGDGWVDVSVSILDEDTVRLVLAKINDVDSESIILQWSNVEDIL